MATLSIFVEQANKLYGGENTYEYVRDISKDVAVELCSLRGLPESGTRTKKTRRRPISIYVYNWSQAYRVDNLRGMTFSF